MTVASPIPRIPTRARTLRDLLEQLGNIPPERVRADPPPGSATERDVIEIEAREDRLCELVDGTLVEKPMGFRESLLAGFLVTMLTQFADEHDLGVVPTPDGTIRLFPGTVRIPDVAFISWSRLPGRRIPSEPIPDLVPDLAVEVLSRTNTDAEMEIKRQEYFRAGVKLVWMVDPQLRQVVVYRSPTDFTRLDESQTLDGGDVLPGFTLAVEKIFARIIPAQ